jgi:hypothetical protein
LCGVDIVCVRIAITMASGKPRRSGSTGSGAAGSERERNLAPKERPKPLFPED